MEIVLFTTHCPRCAVVELKLKEKKITYKECQDVNEMKKLGITSAPYLLVGDKLFGFADAINWIRGQ